MRYLIYSIFASFTLLISLAQTTSSAPLPYHSLTADFAEFFDETSTLPMATRVAAFEKQFDSLLPGFYQPTYGQTQAQFNQVVADALRNFEALRPQYERTEHKFPQDFALAMEKFRRHLPEFRPTVPIWFVHSLGRMDGGTRFLDGKTYLIFGADLIARFHGDDSMGPFLDHEFFHVENGQWFHDCRPDTTIWCSLWQEGTAVYATSIINPGATDHMLMLDLPNPIRRKVDQNWQEALCLALNDLDKTDRTTYASYFLVNDTPQVFPHRWGYYVGYRVVQSIADRYSLRKIDHMSNSTAHKLLEHELGKMATEAGGCEKNVRAN